MSAKQQQFEKHACTLEFIADWHGDDDRATRHTLKICAVHMREAAQGHARYEALRVLTPREFTALWCESLAGERFDALVDELVKAKNEP